MQVSPESAENSDCLKDRQGYGEAKKGRYLVSPKKMTADSARAKVIRRVAVASLKPIALIAATLLLFFAQGSASAAVAVPKEDQHYLDLNQHYDGGKKLVRFFVVDREGMPFKALQKKYALHKGRYVGKWKLSHATYWVRDLSRPDLPSFEVKMQWENTNDRDNALGAVAMNDFVEEALEEASPSISYFPERLGLRSKTVLSSMQT